MKGRQRHRRRCAQRSESDSTTRPGDCRGLHGEPRGGVRLGARQNQGRHPGWATQAQAQPETAPGTWGQNQQWPPPALLLTLPGGAQDHGRGSQMPDNGLGGQNLSLRGTERCCPAQPGPRQTAQHKGSLRQADNSALSGRGRAGWHPLHLCFSLAPVSESLRMNGPGNNEWGAGLRSS